MNDGNWKEAKISIAQNMRTSLQILKERQDDVEKYIDGRQLSVLADGVERTNNKKCKAGILPLGHGLPPHVCVICRYYGDACPKHGLGVTWEGSEDEQEEEQEKEDPQKDGAEEALASAPSKRLKVE